MQASFNLRDFGGYPTGDGRVVKRRMLYRSGTMTLLTEADEDHLRALGIRSICDFRRSNERKAEPTRWHEPAGIAYWSRDYIESSGVLSEILKDEAATPEKMRQAMTHLYREIPADHAPSYSAMFAQLARGDAPLLINCAAGKDRTGVGAALILTMLGVPRPLIDEDYLLTNDHADWPMLFGRRNTKVARVAQSAPELIAPLLAADIAYLDAFFDELDVSHGGVDGYLASIGVDADAKRTIRALLLD
ncbi:MAG: tyrosine-protein phosphatase [Sphingobium phenoxybenzoativorans]